MGPSNAKWASILLLLSLSKILDSEQLISGVVSRDVAMRRQLATPPPTHFGTLFSVNRRFGPRSFITL